MNRRRFIKNGALGVGAAALASPPGQGAAPPDSISQSAIALDNNVRRLSLFEVSCLPISLGIWPALAHTTSGAGSHLAALLNL